MASLPSDAVDIGEFLVHLPAYRVIICKRCRFAVQPNALSGHLQKHRILRRQRRDLLDYLSTLDLVSPSDVHSPPSSTPAIGILPCYEGYKCEHENCTYACTSEKRMRQHWSQVHKCPNHIDVRARPADVQTFFRGTRIQYFEVSGGSQSKSGRYRKRNEGPAAPPELDHASLIPIESADSHEEPQEDYGQETLEFDQPRLKAMMYLHFFTISSGASLGFGLGSDTFWTHDLPRQAPEHPFLLYSILGVAACHQACLASTMDEIKEHTGTARCYSSSALSYFRHSMKKPTLDNGTALAAASRCLGIIELVLSRFEHEEKLQHPIDQITSDEALESLSRFVVMLRGSFDMLLDLQEHLTERSGMYLSQHDKSQMSSLALNSGIDADGHTPTLYTRQTRPCPPGIDARTYERFLLLPSRLASSGITSEEEIYLASRCAGSLLDMLEDSGRAPHETHWRAWIAKQGWVQTTAAREYLMPALNRGLPSAIIVYAYWIYHTVWPTERAYWFSIGLTSRMIELCKIALRRDPRHIALLDDLCTI